MKKKLVVTILSAFLVFGGAAAVFAANDNANLTEIKGLYQQIQDLQKQVVDKQAAAGTLTEEQAASIKTRIDELEKTREQALDNGNLVGPGMGYGSAGCGLGGGCRTGQGFGPGGASNSNIQN